MQQSAPYARRRISDQRSVDSSLSTNHHTDWISEQAKQYEVKELARITGLSEKAVMNLRMGKSGANSKTVTMWCRNCPRFRALYFAHCGGILSGEPELEAALSVAFNAYLRRTQP